MVTFFSSGKCVKKTYISLALKLYKRFTLISLGWVRSELVRVRRGYIQVHRMVVQVPSGYIQVHRMVVQVPIVQA